MSVPSFTSFPIFEEEALKSGDKRDRRDRQHEKSSKSSSSSRRKESERHTERDSRRRDRDRDRDSDGDRVRKRDKGKDRHREKGRNEGQCDEDRRRSHGNTDDLSSSRPDDSYRLFFSDRKPDRLNIQYGGLHAGDVPRYRPIYGRCHAPSHHDF